MKKTIIVCDKCGKTIEGPDAMLFNGELDFCPDCYAMACDLVTQWLNEEDPAPQMQISENDTEPIATSADVKIKAKAPKKRARVKPTKTEKEAAKSIDWDKACALREAGWSVKHIAEELQADIETIRLMIPEYLREYSKGKRFSKSKNED